MNEMVNQFKNKLDKFWSNQHMIYNFKAELTGVGNRSSISVLYDVDIEASACVLSSHYAVLCLMYFSTAILRCFRFNCHFMPPSCCFHYCTDWL